MKLLHIADLHLDRAFEGLVKIPTEIRKTLQTANHHVLTNIIDLAVAQDVDLVIFAGDTFHQSQTSIRVQAFFMEQLQRLAEHQIAVVIVFGNHDYYHAEKYWFSFPENVRIFDTEQVETYFFTTKQHEKVAVSAFSYEQPWIKTSKIKEFPKREDSVAFHIGIYHGEIANDPKARYAPFSVQEMKEKNYDYWALGHIHQSQIISTQPLIIYPGTPQGHTKKERELRGVSLVHLKNGSSTLHFTSVATVNWQVASYSLRKCQNLKEVLFFFKQQIVEQKNPYGQLRLQEVHLTACEHLDEAFFQAVENGELLDYLQELQKQQPYSRSFIYALKLQREANEQKALISADPQLLAQLKKNYLQPDIFSDATRELLQNPVFSAMIGDKEQWRKKSIAHAEKIIHEDFIIQEDHP